MAAAIYVPRINNNDDLVQIREFAVCEGEKVLKGNILATVESDKAAVDIEADREGYVIKILGLPGDTVAVGKPLLWIGDTTDEVVPETKADGLKKTSTAPTAKAQLLLDEYNLNADDIATSGERISVKDVQSHLDKINSQTDLLTDVAASHKPADFSAQLAKGKFLQMSPEQHGMLRTVSWHRDQASVGYVELMFDTAAWERYAKSYMEEHKLMLDPLIPLMAYRLVEIVQRRPAINTTIVDEQIFQYNHVNLGFTVQVGNSLYLPVLKEAETLDAKQFQHKLGLLMRKANTHKLSGSELQGASVGFSSMARWQVARHTPILPPYTSMIVAHAATRNGTSAIGASYDHRTLTGADVVMALRDLTEPPNL